MGQLLKDGQLDCHGPMKSEKKTGDQKAQSWLLGLTSQTARAQSAESTALHQGKNVILIFLRSQTI
jgi:hypothetical protein